ncbi:cAMP and cAMP-inhibited cGMP 3',5'-cyclic phosphodiesterase 10A-like [Anabrus simplex]|uniref:cAMP and cAMP-inhibited cGMP 3',5'-cyclic phosphodiesterase 10A-like n=1 Tax=Anabrus simplex TaxID=316456 RepID=UPI0035A34392
MTLKTERIPAPYLRKTKKDTYDISTLTADKATRRVLAPYVRSLRRSQRISTAKPERGVSLYLQKKPSSLFRNLSEFLLDIIDLPSLLHETAEVLKSVTKSIGVLLYTVISAQGEIVQCPKGRPNERHKVNWKIGPGTTVAAYVAEAKEYILVDDVVKDPRFPESCGWPVPNIKSVLCVPVVTPDDDCIAVIELYRTVREGSYSKTDIEIVVAVAGWMGAAIHQNQQRVALQKQQELNDYLLDLTKCYFADIVFMDKIISEIVSFAKATLGAERGSFFIIDQECDELVADLFDEGIEPNTTGSGVMHKKKLKIRFSKDRGIAGLVAKTGKTVNIKDAYNDPRFNKEVDLQTGFITRSILCMPILGRDGVLGVVQLVNKKNGPCFTNADENIFKTFSVYCALALHYANLQEQMRKVCERRNYELLGRLWFIGYLHPVVLRGLWNNNQKMEKSDALKMKVSSKTEGWYPTGYEDSLSQLVLYIMEDLLGDIISEQELWIQFILTVQKSYRDNPYHNFEHAFNVCHCMYNILKRNTQVFSSVEVQALLVASLCHDLDHRGYTNNFLQMTNHSLSQLYSESPLENHHFQVTMIIINACKIFASFDSTTFRELAQEIHDAVIATDLAFYFRCRSRLLIILDERRFNWSESSHRLLLKSIMMTTCDLSGQCKPFPIAKRITECLYKEFYKQGDTEKGMGMCPLSMMDREKQYMVPDDQINFISVVCLPCINLLAELLPNTEILLEQCITLREHWKEIVELRGQKVWRPEDSIVIDE